MSKSVSPGAGLGAYGVDNPDDPFVSDITLPDVDATPWSRQFSSVLKHSSNAGAVFGSSRHGSSGIVSVMAHRM